MPPKRHTSNGRAASRGRAEEPNDWATFLLPIIEEMRLAVALLRRIELAILIQHGMDPEPEDAPRPRGPSPLSHVLSAWEMASRLPAADLEELRREWATELREWARPIHRARGDTLRLRTERASLLEAIEMIRADDPNVSRAAAGRFLGDAELRPGEMVSLPSGGGLLHLEAVAGPLGATLTEEEHQLLLKETEDLRNHSPRDDRDLRRFVSGKLKKSRGGIGDIDQRLLR